MQTMKMAACDVTHNYVHRTWGAINLLSCPGTRLALLLELMGAI